MASRLSVCHMLQLHQGTTQHNISQASHMCWLSQASHENHLSQIL